jgi:PAS domain S-box-containing protein
VRRKDGSIFPAYVVDTLIRDAQDRPVGITGVSVDISERKAVEEELRRQKEILQTIFDQIPVMINFIDENDRIQLVNRAWERTLGWSLDEIRQQNPDVRAEAYPDPQSHQEVLDFWARSNGEWVDFRPRVRDGQVIDTSWASIRLSDGTRIGIGIDITKRKRAEEAEREQRVLAEALRDTAAALNSTLDFGEVLERILENVGRVVAHDTSDIVLLDQGYWRVVGQRGFTERRLKEWQAGLHLPFEQRPLLRRAVETATPQIIADTQTDPNWVTAPEIRWIRSYISAPIHIKGEVIGALNLQSAIPNFFTPEHVVRLQAFLDQAAVALENARLLQEVQAARERLQTLSQQLLGAQEAERRAIARELHDEIGQVLTAVGTNLRVIELAPDPATRRERLAESLKLIDEALKQVRDLALDLRPSLLDDFGLVPALEWYIDRQAQRGGFRAGFVAEPADMRLPPALETTVFRVAQIALTNVLRHAQAKHVQVVLRRDAAALELVIRDDGVGFDVPAALARATRGATLGLLSMQERVRLAGGQIAIHAAPGQGTEVRARWPLA